MSGFAAYTPQQTIEIVGRAGVAKAHIRYDKTFFSSVMAGMLLSFACGTLLTANSSEWFQENAPGTIRVIGALVFPYGLSMIVLSGVDLCTGSFLYTTVSVLQGRLGPTKALIHWVITFFGNLAGSLFIVTIIAGYGGLFSTGYYRTEAINFATTKQLVPMWHQIFIRAIGANWLVCMACMLGMSGRDYASKLVGIWFPTFAFGMYLPLRYCCKTKRSADTLTSLAWLGSRCRQYVLRPNWHLGGCSGYHRWPLYLEGMNHTIAMTTFGVLVLTDVSQGIIPALIGNIIGGGLFVGVWYWYLHLSSNGPVSVDGLFYEPIHGHGDTNGITKGLAVNGFSIRGNKSSKADEEKAVAAGEEHGG